MGHEDRLRRVIEEALEESVEKDLPSGEPLDHAHGGATAWAGPGPRRRRGRCFDAWGYRINGEGLPAFGQAVRPTPRGEEAEVADPNEALRQDVQEKASEEFVGCESERADLAAVAIVLPPKRHRVVGHSDQPVIRDGHPVRVSREILQHVGRTAKGRLGIDHPALSKEGPEKGPKGGRGGERLERPRKVQSALVKGVAQAGDEFPAKDLPEHLHGKKEGLARVDPSCAVRGHAAGRHHAMDVRMMLQALAPRVEDHQPADGGAEALRVGRDLEQRGRRGAEEEVVHDVLVRQRQARQQFGHGENHVHVADGQEFLLARRHPLVSSGVRHFGQCRSRQLLYQRPVADTAHSDRDGPPARQSDTGPGPEGRADGGR